jgi:hypothetical protein
MFTIKLFKGKFDRFVYQCDFYSVEQNTSENIQINLFKMNGNEQPAAAYISVNVGNGESAYIENEEGKTIDTIRFFNTLGQTAS